MPPNFIRLKRQLLLQGASEIATLLVSSPKFWSTARKVQSTSGLGPDRTLNHPISELNVRFWEVGKHLVSGGAKSRIQVLLVGGKRDPG